MPRSAVGVPVSAGEGMAGNVGWRGGRGSLAAAFLQGACDPSWGATGGWWMAGLGGLADVDRMSVQVRSAAQLLLAFRSLRRSR
eukprot:scaffold3653_cov111-Isochrysis_galbana.AAC.2